MVKVHCLTEPMLCQSPLWTLASCTLSEMFWAWWTCFTKKLKNLAAGVWIPSSILSLPVRVISWEPKSKVGNVTNKGGEMQGCMKPYRTINRKFLIQLESSIHRINIALSHTHTKEGNCFIPRSYNKVLYSLAHYPQLNGSCMWLEESLNFPCSWLCLGASE